MHYVKQFKVCGVDTKQVACIELQGKPNAATEGALGVLGIDVTSPSHDVYKCVAVNGSIYTWELLSSGMSIISATINTNGENSVQFPYKVLQTPTLYIVKMGDLILDKEGYLYQINSIDSTYCTATYCGTQIAKYGKSAYDLAVKEGFEGSESEWIESLKGDSPYDIARQNGFEGTEEEWLASLEGKSGVYLGEEEPTDPDTLVWVDPTGESTKVNDFANALRGNKSGSIISISDISPLPHDIKVGVTSVYNPQLLHVHVLGKNIIHIPDIDNSYNVSSKTWKIPCYIPHTVTISAKKNGLVVRDSTGADRNVWHIQVTFKNGSMLYMMNNAEPFQSTFKGTPENPIVEITYRGIYIVDGYYGDFQVELGSVATEYEPYIEPTPYGVKEDYTVEGITFTHPTTTLMTDVEEAIVKCEYNRDINKAFAEISNALISLGGNI